MLPGAAGWPDTVAERYRSQGYWLGVPLGSLLRDPARGPDSVAVITATGEHTYGELSARADRLAAGMRSIGIGSGDRVLVQLPNTPDFVVVSVALFRIGAIPVMAVPGLRKAELQHLCDHTEAVAVVLPDVWHGFDYRDLARELSGPKHVLVAGDPGGFTALSTLEVEPTGPLPAVDPSEVAFLLLSGGTTSLPKLIPRTHDDYGYQIRATADAIGFDRASAYVAALPVAHNAALGCPGVLGALAAGGIVALADTPSPDDVFPLVARVADASLVATTLMPALIPVWREAGAGWDVDFTRMMVEVGGANIDADALRAFETALGCTATRWFGMAEGPLSFTRPYDPDEYRLTGEGYPLSLDDEYVVLGPDGSPLPAGEIGELLVRGPTTLRGYYREPVENAARFTPDGFLRTGDLARLDGDGTLTISGRTGDVINRGGEKVPATLVESMLADHPAVRACAVTAAPDPVLTEKVAAFVVCDGPAPALADVVAFLRGRGLSEVCVPEHLIVLDALPMTEVGKVDKKVLRKHFGAL